MGTKRCNIAVVGLGNIGQAVHAPIAYQHARSRLWGVYEPRKGLAGKVVSRLKKTYKRTSSDDDEHLEPEIYESFEVLVNDSQIDAAILCVPHELHIPMAKQLLEQGKAVLCEKPLCTTSDAGTQFLEYLKSNHFDEKFFIGYMWRWDPSVLLLRSFVNGQRYGISKHPQHLEEFFLTGNYNSWAGNFKPIRVWRLKKRPKKIRPAYLHSVAESRAYEWLIDVWSHQSNLTQFLLATPRKVKDVKIRFNGGSFSFVEEFDGFASNCTFAWMMGNKFYRGMRISYGGTDVNLELQVPLNRDQTAKLEIFENKMPVKYDASNMEFKWMYQIQFERFLDLVEKNFVRIKLQDNQESLQQALNDIKLCENVIKSYQQKRQIPFENDREIFSINQKKERP